MIRDVWRKYNVSTIFVLPLFWDITLNVVSSIKGSLKIPFTQLAIEYGLENTFLYRNKRFDGHLYLQFSRDFFCENKQLSSSVYYSICELLVDCKYFSTIEILNDKILVGLKIPDRFLSDIILIEQGLYSKLSVSYKEEIKIKQATVPITPNKLAMYISTKNLGYSISQKNASIKEELEKELRIKIEKTSEYYERFSGIKENID